MGEKLLSTVFVWSAMLVLALVSLLWDSAEAVGQYNRGKSLYQDKCQLCHGESGKGDGPAASAFNPSPANFTDRTFWQGDPEKKIIESIRKGKGSMPAFTLSAEEIEEIIDFISHTFKKS